MKSEVESTIKSLNGRVASSSRSAAECMQLAQAALTMAHTMEVLDNVNKTRESQRYPYLMVFDDGQIMKSLEFSVEDKRNVDKGIMDVIDISGEEPKQYLDGKWHALMQTVK